MPVAILLTGCGLHLLAGLLAVARRGLPGTAVSVVAVVASACLGVAGVWALAEPSTSMLQLPWLVPGGGISISVDALSAVFLLPIAVLGGACSIYARAYWDTQPSGRRTRAAVAVRRVSVKTSASCSLDRAASAVGSNTTSRSSHTRPTSRALTPSQWHSAYTIRSRWSRRQGSQSTQTSCPQSTPR